MELKALLGAAVIAVSMPIAAQAVPLSLDSQLDIVGVVNVQTSHFAPGGALDFDQGSPANLVAISTGDFATFVNVGDTPTLFDLTFTPTEVVYTVGGFTFTATGYFDFDNSFPGRAFAANGIISGNGFDNTKGLLTFSTQANNPNQVNASFSSTTTVIPLPASVLMLLAALGGLGVISRRRSATA